jgi:hypothetical protein
MPSLSACGPSSDQIYAGFFDNERRPSYLETPTISTQHASVSTGHFTSPFLADDSWIGDHVITIPIDLFTSSPQFAISFSCYTFVYPIYYPPGLTRVSGITIHATSLAKSS